MQLPDALGGGWLDAGTVGTYYPSGDLSGPAAFTRREVRLDFAWDAGQKPGGSNDPKYAAVPADGWSASYVGRVGPRFTETYTLALSSSGRARLFYRVTGSSTWTTLIDRWTPHSASTDTATLAMTAGASYDLRVDYAKSAGAAVLALDWSSPSAPLQVLDTVRNIGQVISLSAVTPTADLVRTGRNSWINGVPPGLTPTDSDGWPLFGDVQLIFTESVNQGLNINPLMRGKVTYSFKGGCSSVGMFPPSGSTTPTVAYDAGTNTTSGSFTLLDVRVGAYALHIAGAFRDGPGGSSPGFTDLHMWGPVAPDATTSYASGSTYTPFIRAAFGDHFTAIRFQVIAGQEVNWSDRTPETYFNQAGGKVTAPQLGFGGTTANGTSWGWKVMLANETGRDLLLSIPTPVTCDPADPTSYVYRLANLIRYGSDGVNPYTSPQANPAFPPLNPNLRVQFEIGNELWNLANPFLVDFVNIDTIVAADRTANNSRWRAISYDGSIAGSFTCHDRHIIYRTCQMADCFRAVWGPGALFARIRPIFFFQYGNVGGTASIALSFDNYMNNADGTAHVADPHPWPYWLWGAGGATYYSASNPDGVTDLLPNPRFAAPDGPSIAYTGTAGAAAYSGSGSAIDAGAVPPPYVPAGGVSTGRVGYIQGTGSISFQFTTPTAQVSPWYGACFKAHNRKVAITNVAVASGVLTVTLASAPSQPYVAGTLLTLNIVGTLAALNGSYAVANVPNSTTVTFAKTTANIAGTAVTGSLTDNQNLKVAVDGVDQTAKTFNQSNGVVAPAWTTAAWSALNVYWTPSNYYASKLLTLAPGTMHTVTIAGSVAGSVAFLGEVRVASADAIFASDFPAGGQATGQPAQSSLQLTTEIEGDYPHAWGLVPEGYEGGCSLGGDDGGSPLQQQVKYADSRLADRGQASLDQIAAAWDGGLICLGTYSQWPGFTEPYAEEGLQVGIEHYPLVQGVDRALALVPPPAQNGYSSPCTLLPGAATIALTASVSSGSTTAPGGLLAWPVVVDRSGPRTLSAVITGTGTAVLLFDGDEVARGTGAGTLSGTVTPYRGIHSIKVRQEGSTAITVASVALAEPGAPAAPAVSAAVAPLSASFSWPAVAGATGYRFRMGTRPGRLHQQFDLGPATQFTPPGLVAGQTYYVAVHAYNGSGDSLPGTPAALALAGFARSVTLAAWDTAGVAANAVTPPLPAALTTGGVTGSTLTVSPSVTAGSRVGNSFEYNSRNGVTLAATLAGAVAAGQYLQFAITPPAGFPVNLESIKFYPFWWHSSLYPSAGFGWAYQLGGGAWSAAATATGPLSASSSAPAAWTLDLSGIAGLQALTQPAAFRFYFFGGGEGVGIGDSSGYDLAVSGSFVPVSTVVGRRRLRVPGLRPFT